MAHAKSFLPGGLKFNFASVKNNHKYAKKCYECVFGCRVHNIISHATTPDMIVLNYEHFHKYKLTLTYIQAAHPSN